METMKFAAALAAYLAAFPALTWLCTQISKYAGLSAVFCVGFTAFIAYDKYYVKSKHAKGPK